MKNWIITALAATLVVLIIDFGNAGSSKRAFDEIRLGTSAEDASRILTSRGIRCDAVETRDRGLKFCDFVDPWRRYILNFDDSGILVQKISSFRRPRGLLIRTLFGP